ncbi:MAG TPA: dihydroneopterin aldolase [Chitinophagaceae bacterium]
MLSIELRRLRFHAFHGVFPEERILGNEYEADLSVSFIPAALPVYQLGDTMDYTSLYEMVKRRMAIPTPLLETIATEISDEIRLQYPQVTGIRISIRKLYPPVNSFEGTVGVSFEWNKPLA